jgi:hypothetical protein
MLMYLFKKTKKIFGAGLSTYVLGLAGAGVGISVVFVGSILNLKMIKLKKMLIYLFKKNKKIFGAGLSTYVLGLAGAGVGIGVVFDSLIIRSSINFITSYFKESFKTLTLKYVILALKEISFALSSNLADLKLLEDNWNTKP